MTDGIVIETTQTNITGEPVVVEDDDGDASSEKALYESLGVNKEGKCLRHNTCPVLNVDTLVVVPCRVCFSEEKSVGIRQSNNTLQTVVQELHRQSLSQSSLNTSNHNNNNTSTSSNLNNNNASFTSIATSESQYEDTTVSSPLESIVKRLTQVHNWLLRQKEKEILTMKLQMHKLEQKLQTEMASNHELKTTVKALRKTIQQDLRLIRHMQDTTTTTSPEQEPSPQKTVSSSIEQGPDRKLQRAFQSFRGGLLDIPKSPPPAGGKKKKQIDKAAMGALQMMKTPSSAAKEIPLDVLAAKLAQKHGGQRKIQGQSPEQFFPGDGSLASHHGLPKLELLAEEPEETETTTKMEKTVFTVTGAVSQDKFGDEGRYTGQILVTTGLPHGKGCMEYESGRRYEGDWVSGQWDGSGQLQNPNGDSYHGEFCLDARHGKGVYKWDNGDVYTGEFRSDKRHGKGQFDFFNGNKYVGQFCNGMFQGHGKYEFSGGHYEGEWKEGRYDGSGELFYANGGKYTGEFRNSVAHGFGMEVLAGGHQRRGVWKDGKPSEVFDNIPKQEVEQQQAPPNDLD